MPFERVAPPNLPMAESTFTARFFEQFTNVLRLFFNRLVSSVNELLEREEAFVVPISNETTALTTGLKRTWRMPYPFTLTAVRASVSTAQGSGALLTFDVQQEGVSVLSTLITIDNGEETSTTAATPPVISNPAIADDAELTFHIDQIGTSGASGAVIYLIGYQ